MDDAHLPRHERRFPYRATNPEEEAEIRREISDWLRDNQGLLMAQLQELQANARAHDDTPIDDGTIDGWLQDMRIRLASYAFPRFDRSQGAKLSTFLYFAIHRLGQQYIRERLRRRRNRPEVNETDAIKGTSASNRALDLLNASADTAMDDRITEISDDVRLHPERYLSRRQADVLRAVVAAPPGTPLITLAEQLGYDRASSLSMILRRIRERIASISVEDWSPHGDVTYCYRGQPGASRRCMAR